jgi:hypothetical protein
MKCAYCGTENPAGYLTCGNCKAILSGVGGAPVAPKIKKALPLYLGWLILLVSPLLMFGSLGLLAADGGSKPGVAVWVTLALFCILVISIIFPFNIAFFWHRYQANPGIKPIIGLILALLFAIAWPVGLPGYGIIGLPFCAWLFKHYEIKRS